jgi:hypothetical protein
MKFDGTIGFSTQTEVSPGVWDNSITRKTYRGDILNPARANQFDGYKEGSSSIHDAIKVQNRISVVADDYANDNLFSIRFVEWRGVPWEVTKVKVEPPRLILSLGGVYNGPTTS